MPMTTRVTVTALQTLEYEGQEYRAGESFQAKPIEAAALAYRRKVSLTRAPRYRTTALEPEPIVAPPEARRGRGRPRKTDPDRPKRQYRRRDMVAEPSE